MAVITICNDFGAPKNKVCHWFHCFPIYLPWSDVARCLDLKFSECWVLSQLFQVSSFTFIKRQFSECWVLSQLFQLSSFTFIKRLFSSSSLSAIRVVSSAYLRLLIFLPSILIPACASSNPVKSICRNNLAEWCIINPTVRMYFRGRANT